MQSIRLYRMLPKLMCLSKVKPHIHTHQCFACKHRDRGNEQRLKIWRLRANANANALLTDGLKFCN